MNGVKKVNGKFLHNEISDFREGGKSSESLHGVNGPCRFEGHTPTIFMEGRLRKCVPLQGG
jgi:hypothetical protein